MGSELLDDLDYLDQSIPKQIYSGFWIRLGAAIFDWIALLIILLFWVYQRFLIKTESRVLLPPTGL